MFFLIGIDDTDDASSPGTGNLGWNLGLKLEQTKRCRLISVTRHQLLIDHNLPCTARNSAACVLIESTQDFHHELELTSREYLRRQSAPGSDPGFVLAPWSSVSPAVVAWGRLAKDSILERQAAIELARKSGLSIAGFTGSGNGVIGALAAVGLFHSGNDGRFFWLRGLRELSGVYSVDELIGICPIDRVENLFGRRPITRDRINVGSWARPILRDGKSLLLLEASEKGKPYEWEVLSRERVDQLSS